MGATLSGAETHREVREQARPEPATARRLLAARLGDVGHARDRRRRGDRLLDGGGARDEGAGSKLGGTAMASLLTPATLDALPVPGLPSAG